MSFALTEAQLLDGSKDVTRRTGWENLRVGEIVIAIRKGMGLAKGEKQVVLGMIQIRSVTRERLCRITYADCRREGFPELRPIEFIDFFCKANKCPPDSLVTRIEFEFSRELLASLRPTRRTRTRQKRVASHGRDPDRREPIL